MAPAQGILPSGEEEDRTVCQRSCTWILCWSRAPSSYSLVSGSWQPQASFVSSRHEKEVALRKARDGVRDKWLQPGAGLGDLMAQLQECWCYESPGLPAWPSLSLLIEPRGRKNLALATGLQTAAVIQAVARRARMHEPEG